MPFFRPSWRTAAAVRIAGSVTVSALALLSACAPDLGPAPRIRPVADYAAQRALGPADPAAVWPGLDWWKAYNDPQLTALIEEALKDAPDLRMAQARVRQALAIRERANAALLPTVGVKGAVDGTAVSLNLRGIPANVGDFLPKGVPAVTELSGSLSYQLDFFGKNHAALAAASSEAREAQFELAAAQLQLSTGVAAAYADLVRLTADREAAAEAVRVRRDSLKLVSDRLRNGLENQSQQAQSSAESNISLGDLALLDQRIEETRHQLAALIGAGPDRGLDIIPNPKSVGKPFSLPSNLPVDLIGRRPDVAAARMRVEAAAARIKVARADFYPNVSLTGSALVASLNPQDIISHNAVLGQVGPAISLPIFQGGRLEGAYRGARGEYDEAVANYDKTVVQALREVSDAISAQRSIATQLGFAQQASADSDKAYTLANMRYKGGLSPYVTVLTAESTFVAQRRAAADLQAQTLAANVALVRALGGGFIDDISSANASSSKGPSHG
jgi:NodT family efflux transporter outer membrane factor (OMF) lipoprotein